MSRLRALSGILVVLAVLPATFRASTDSAVKPRRVDLVEKTGVRLAQVDVTVRRDGAPVEGLRPGDFTLRVGDRAIESKLVDFVCARGGVEGEPENAVSRPPTYVFYFDQRHLTTEGRRRAFETARELVPSLVRDGGRVTVVSSGRSLTTPASRATDPAALLAALDAIERDPAQIDVTATRESTEVAQLTRDVLDGRADALSEATAAMDAIDPNPGKLVRMAHGGGSSSAPSGAFGRSGSPNARSERQAFAANRRADLDRKWVFGETIDSEEVLLAGRAAVLEEDERRLARAEWDRLRAVLAGLEADEPPKAMVYFADTMRRNAGEHYLRLVEEDLSGANAPRHEGRRIGTRTAGTGSHEIGVEPWFDAVVDEANAHGVRLYPVHAEGMTDGSRRFRDVEATLVSLALDTGGRSFLRGVGADAIGRDIASDLGCVYVLSFDPAGLPEDRALPVRIEIDRPGVSALTRSRITIQSEGSRRSARVLAAFATGGGTGDAARLRAEVIPTGYRNGKFVGLVQVAVSPPADEPGAWDLGFSVASGDRLESNAASRLETSVPGVPLVLEQEITFRSDAYRVWTVAQQASSDVVASASVEGAWPSVERDAAAVGPIAIVQPSRGGFRRGDATRTRGSLAVPEGSVVSAGLPAAFVGVVCRGDGVPGPVTVERELRGENGVRFPDILIDRKDDDCVATRDLVRADSLGAGSFVYEVRIVSAGREIARGERKFGVAGPATAAAPRP